MITKPFVGVLCCLGLAALPLAATAQACLKVDHGWARLPPPGSTMSAGYARLQNTCAAAVSIVGVQGSSFGEVSLHETVVEGGVSRMRAVPRLEVPARGTVELRPGGLHLMLMQPSTALVEGRQLPLALALADGSSVAFTLTVQRSGATGHAH